MGDSLGGIMSWYLLTREPDVEAVVCHCISHPDVHHDPAMRWKAPLIRALARVAPALRIPVDQIADYSAGGARAADRALFHRAPGPPLQLPGHAALGRELHGVRARASRGSGSRRRSWSRSGTRTAWSPASTPSAASSGRGRRARRSCRCPGMGHQLYLDHLADALPPTVEWIERAAGRDRRRRCPARVITGTLTPTLRVSRGPLWPRGDPARERDLDHALRRRRSTRTSRSAAAGSRRCPPTTSTSCATSAAFSWRPA